MEGFDPAGCDAHELLLCDRTADKIGAQYLQYWFNKTEEKEVLLEHSISKDTLTTPGTS